jgi:hypothetical protein
MASKQPAQQSWTEAAYFGNYEERQAKSHVIFPSMGHSDLLMAYRLIFCRPHGLQCKQMDRNESLG